MQNLITLAKQLAEQYPELATRIEKGSIIALAGRVKTEPAKVRKAGGVLSTVGVYFVSLWETAPGGAKWQCDCVDATIGNAPHIDDFMNGSGKVCKHVVALALVKEAGNLTPVKTVLSWVTRIVESGWVDAFCPEIGGTVQLMGKVSLKHIYTGGVYKIVLTAPYLQSGEILRQGTWGDDEGRTWMMPSSSKKNYDEFVSKLKESK